MVSCLRRQKSLRILTINPCSNHLVMRGYETRQKNELIRPTKEYMKKSATVHLQGLGTTVILSLVAAQPLHLALMVSWK